MNPPKIAELENYVKDGRLKVQYHPTLDLAIYNYSSHTQYDNLWDDITLQARGLIVHRSADQIIARPFQKFFNWEEGRHQESDSFDIFTKMDGSLGILFYFEGSWHHASRGSFESEQAEKFREIWKRLYKNKESALDPEYTYLWEIIYPENQIVVNYGEMCNVFLLGAIHTQSGIENHNVLSELAELFPVVSTYPAQASIQELKALNIQNAEGFVLRFDNGDRCKVKFAEYIQLHALMTELSTLDIWRYLKDNTQIPEHLLSRIPDELYQSIQKVEQELHHDFAIILDRHQSLIEPIKSIPERKNQAQAIMKSKSHDVYPKILFALLDDRSVDGLIWELLRPEYRKIGE